MISGLNLGNVAVAMVKGGGGRHHHCHIDGAGERQRDDDFLVGKAEELTPIGIALDRHATLS